MSFSTGGEGPCPYHKRVLVKWEVRGRYSFTAGKKSIRVGLSEGIGKIECKALSEDGRCQVDLGPCPTEKIIEFFITPRRR